MFNGLKTSRPCIKFVFKELYPYNYKESTNFGVIATVRTFSQAKIRIQARQAPAGANKQNLKLSEHTQITQNKREGYFTKFFVD